MPDASPALSTQQAARLLGVHDSSIKRWCSAGDLECDLTPGGHRRISMDVLARFARSNDLPLPLLAFGEDAPAVWAALDKGKRAKDWGDLVDRSYAWMEQGDAARLVALINWLLSENESMAEVFDRVVGPTMARVGMAYQSGSVSIGDEHRMTQCMRDALIALTPLGRPAAREDVPTCVVGCARNEEHELGALMARGVLISAGWRVVYLGANVPTEDFAEQQAKHHASMVCVAFMLPGSAADVLNVRRLLEQMASPAAPYTLVFGGKVAERALLTAPGISDLEVLAFGRMEPFGLWAEKRARVLSTGRG